MEVRAEIVRLHLAETFVISRESQDWADVVHVTIEHDGHRGRGEAAPMVGVGVSAAAAGA
jgi:L-alanine-DL-glutamate epimerase-like enolase superfamily enzyme